MGGERPTAIERPTLRLDAHTQTGEGRPAPASGAALAPPGSRAAHIARAAGGAIERMPGGRVAVSVAPPAGGAGRRPLARLRMPDLPKLPSMPGVPRRPEMPSMPGLPAAPALPAIPAIPALPAMPDLSSPAGIADTAGRAADALGVEIPPQVAGLLGGAPGGGGGGGGGAPSVDEIYEGVIERLRRDLIVERERMGDLLGNLGH